jgi:colicin import membrane protein
MKSRDIGFKIDDLKASTTERARRRKVWSKKIAKLEKAVARSFEDDRKDARKLKELGKALAQALRVEKAAEAKAKAKARAEEKKAKAKARAEEKKAKAKARAEEKKAAAARKAEEKKAAAARKAEEKRLATEQKASEPVLDDHRIAAVDPEPEVVNGVSELATERATESSSEPQPTA